MIGSHHGLLLLNKKSGISSFDSLKGVKRAFATGKAGHTGTLDKFATGLLVVLVGRGVKLAPVFKHCDKEYYGTFHFGLETDTLDPEGAVVAQAPLPEREAVESILDSFRGNILQAPPAFSALHINGRRAHELVRQGVEVEMKKRPVTVYRLEIQSWNPPEAVIRVSCSAGTYIRSLARDIALAAGSRAYLSALTRTRVGGFNLESAVEDSGNDENLIHTLRPLDRKLFESAALPYFLIDERASENFIHGRALDRVLEKGQFFSAPGMQLRDEMTAGIFKINDPDKLMGIIGYRNGAWSYGHVFADN